MTGAKWLAAVAAVALLGAPALIDEAAAARAKVAVKKKVAKRPVRRAKTVVRVNATPLAAPLPVAVPMAPALDYSDYRWLDEAEAMLDLIAGAAPDFRFGGAGGVRDAWGLHDGSMIIASPLESGAARLYFFSPDTTAPFFVRDGAYSYAFERGRLLAMYDDDGRLLPIRSDGAEEQARFLYGDGRALWFAARTPLPVAAARRNRFSVDVSIGSGAWGYNEGLRAYRRGAGHDRWRQREERYRRERDERAARRTPGADGSWSGGDAGRRGAARDGDRRQSGERSPRADGRSWAGQRPTRNEDVRMQSPVAAPAADAERPDRRDRADGPGVPSERPEAPRRRTDPPAATAPLVMGEQMAPPVQEASSQPRREGNASGEPRREREAVPLRPVREALVPLPAVPEPAPVARAQEPEASPPSRERQTISPRAADPEPAPPPAPREPERTPTLRENERPQ